MRALILSLILCQGLLFGPPAVLAAKLRVATEGAYPPFSYFDDAGQLAGFDVDIAQALCEQLAAECELSARPWEELIPALVSGEVDFVVASMGSSEERDLLVDFTGHYYRSHSIFVGPRDVQSEISPSALAGQRLVSGKGTLQSKYLQEFYPNSEIILTEDMEQAIGLLRSGSADLIFSDTIFMLQFLQSDQGEGYDFIGSPLRNALLKSEACIAVQQGNDQLRILLNRAIEQIRLNGVYDRINQKYFPFDIY